MKNILGIYGWLIFFTVLTPTAFSQQNEFECTVSVEGEKYIAGKWNAFFAKKYLAIDNTTPAVEKRLSVNELEDTSDPKYIPITLPNSGLDDFEIGFKVFYLRVARGGTAALRLKVNVLAKTPFTDNPGIIDLVTDSIAESGRRGTTQNVTIRDPDFDPQNTSAYSGISSVKVSVSCSNHDQIR